MSNLNEIHDKEMTEIINDTELWLQKFKKYRNRTLNLNMSKL